MISDPEFQQVKAVPPADREAAIGARFDGVTAPLGDPDIPFADVIEDPSGRETLKNRLLQMDWTFCRAASAELVLGDAGVLLERGDSEVGWRIIMGPSSALSIRSVVGAASPTISDAALEPWQVQALNHETTARSKRLLIAGSRDALLAVKEGLWGRDSTS
ncbi:MAG: hypothetical protein E6G94_09730 [Alphaproteobacteria bacterium]|nr:MAG: hypothetical protein E6G94_09730 [Alphaproteobacteria bacterium]